MNPSAGEVLREIRASGWRQVSQRAGLRCLQSSGGAERVWLFDDEEEIGPLALERIAQAFELSAEAIARLTGFDP
jgi:hypothetical protein